jgi:hypothetical protein
MGVCELDWPVSGYGSLADSTEEPSGSLKGGEGFHQLSDYQLLRRFIQSQLNHSIKFLI